MKRFALMLMAFALGHSASADEIEEVPSVVFRAFSIRCEFDRGTQASWDGGTLKLESARAGSGGAVTFDSIDTKEGKARIVGNVGAGDVMLLVTQAGITFVEITLLGNVNVTTVFAAPYSSDRRRFAAVQSRHAEINGPFPAQYHGVCRVLEERDPMRR